MSVASWERQLLDLAYEGIHGPSSELCDELEASAVMRGYKACADITHQHSRTFSLASGLLPPGKRQAARALYAFCRLTDDIVDQRDDGTGLTPRTRLNNFRVRALADCPDDDDILMLAWVDTQTTYGVPKLYAEQLIDGVARDLAQDRYNTFEELASYCYGVASTVGLMAMHIIGFSGPEAVPYAVKLGVALQLTNILRDVGEDWLAGRLYLPQEELEAYELSEDDVARGVVDERWRAFMSFQIDRVRRLYAASMPGIGLLHRDGRFAIGAAAELYRAILNDIESHGMDVFSRRASASAVEKLRRLPGIWWRSQVWGYGSLEQPSGHDEVSRERRNLANRYPNRG